MVVDGFIFKEDTDKYKFTHLSSSIKFIPYGVIVDEFQHYIYKNPNVDKSKRKEIWRFLEKNTYLIENMVIILFRERLLVV